MFICVSFSTGPSTVIHWLATPHTVLVIKKHHDPFTARTLDTVTRHLKTEYGCTTLIEDDVAMKTSCQSTPVAKDEVPLLRRVVDFIVTLGGDGTLLHVSQLFQHEVPPVLSFSLGTLGFLMPFEFKNYKAALKEVMTGGFSVVERMRLHCKVYSNLLVGHEPKCELHVLNEVVLHRGAEAHSVAIEIHVEDHYVTTVTADGIIAATSSGSTAYSLSSGGSIVHPGINGILITPISPASLSFRPVIFPPTASLKLRVSSSSLAIPLASFDGKKSLQLFKGDYIHLKSSPHPMATVARTRVDTADWIHDVTEKLNWNYKRPVRKVDETDFDTH
mmetsp:Transcript_39675/g.64357  ORF Transcript_39675/g.64357 Transcript_39675/m.64357 type:complete len:332 (+) Transcript_39675:1428-2423(+)